MAACFHAAIFVPLAMQCCRLLSTMQYLYSLKPCTRHAAFWHVRSSWSPGFGCKVSSSSWAAQQAVSTAWHRRAEMAAVFEKHAAIQDR